MKYTDLLKKLQKENKNHIVLIKNGIFFIAIGKDALELNKILGLKLTCMKDKLCKAGFQAKSLEKYVLKLKNLNKSFVVFIYDKEQKKEELIFKYTGEPVLENKDCDCENCSQKKLTEEEIIERVKKLGTEAN